MFLVRNVFQLQKVVGILSSSKKVSECLSYLKTWWNVLQLVKSAGMCYRLSKQPECVTGYQAARMCQALKRPEASVPKETGVMSFSEPGQRMVLDWVYASAVLVCVWSGG